MLRIKLLRRPLIKGVGYSGHLSSRAPHIPLLLSKMAQGRMLHHPFVRAAPIIALIVGIQITLLVNALRAKTPGKIKRTRTKCRLIKSGMEGLISLHLLIFPRVHQS